MSERIQWGQVQAWENSALDAYHRWHTHHDTEDLREFREAIAEYRKMFRRFVVQETSEDTEAAAGVGL